MQEIYRRELENWEGSDDEESDSQSEEDESDDQDEDDGCAQLNAPPATDYTEGQSMPVVSLKVEVEPLETAVVDERPQPRPFEALRDFFARTSITWQDIVLAKMRQDGAMNKSIKEIRKIAFDMSEIKWWDSREEISALEDEQDEAGIGEVIDMAKRSSEAGTGSRRR